MKRTTGALIAILCIANICYGTTMQQEGNICVASERISFSSDIFGKQSGVLISSDIMERTMELVADRIVTVAVNRKKLQIHTYWMTQVGEYQISLQDFVTGESLKLVLGKDGVEQVVRTYQKDEYGFDITAVPFENLLGHNGIYICTKPNEWSCFTEYYGIEDGELICLADSWGYQRDDYMVDLDGDGDKELICNVTFLADGAACTLVYDYDGEQVLNGWGDNLLDVEYDNWGTNSTWSEYLPEKNVICISYSKKEGGYGTKEYMVDLEAMDMETYIKW